MADVFMIWAAGDRPRVAAIAEALQARGLDVSWDHDLLAPADRAARLAGARVVSPVWSRESTIPGFVLEEAKAGKLRGVLAPIFIDKVEAPLGYGQFQGADLSAGPAGPAFDAFVATAQAARSGKPQRLVSDAPARPRKTPWLTIALGALVLIGAGYFFLSRQGQPPATEPLPDTLGVAERYGLSDAEIASLAPDALAKKALEHSTVEELDAAAAEDKLSLGLLCAAQYYGVGTTRNEAAAAQTCARGAEQNAPGAGYLFSLLTRAGLGGLTADPAAADAILQTASDAGDTRAEHEMAQGLRARRPVQARKLAEQCAAQGHLGCRFLVAQMMAGGEGAKKDVAGARAAYEAMAGDYFGPAARELGKFQRDGVGGPASDEEAVLSFKRAAVLDDGEASFLLGQMAEQGRGMPKSADDAQQFYRDAEADGYAPATEAAARLAPAERK